MFKRKYYLLLLIFFAYPIVLPALNPDKGITQYVQRIWTKDDGLPQMSVPSIAQTNDGFLWFATEEGLARFDGVQFNIFNARNTKAFSNNAIRKVIKESGHGLWIATRGGDLIEYKEGQFINHSKAFGLPEGQINSIFQDKNGTLWVGAQSSVGTIKNGHFEPLKDKTGFQPKINFPIFQDREGSIWIESFRWNDGTFQKIPGFPEKARVTSITQDSSGALWFGTEGEGLVRYGNGKSKIFTTADGLGQNTVRALLEDHDGNLWIGTTAGLNRFHNGTFDLFTAKQGLSDNQLWSLFEDSEGNIWAGTNGGGLNRFSDGAFETFSLQEGLSSQFVFSVLEDREGTIWLGTENGLNRFKNKAFTSFTTKDGLPSNEVMSLWQDRSGALWIGTGSGLSKFYNGKFSNFGMKEGLPEIAVLSIFEDSSGVLWVSIIGGLMRFENGNFNTFFPVQKRPAASSITQSIDGSVLFNVLGGGFRSYQNGKLNAFTEKDGLSNDYAICIYPDKQGAVWIGTFQGGLSRYYKGKFTNYSTQNGLHNDVIYQILEDDQANLWMSSNEGVFRVSKKELNDFADGKLTSIHSVAYGRSDGMRSAECNGGQSPAGWKSKDGRLWFGTTNGVAVVDPKKLFVNQSLPEVQIEELIVNEGKTISLQQKQSGLSISPGVWRMEFHYTVPSFTAPEKVKFIYQLDGFDPKWIHGEKERIAHYSKIPPGNYTFRVKASQNEKDWSDAATAISFRVEPYFYQTLWFYILCGISILTLGWFIHRYRLNRLLELERIRTRIATDLHDDIGAGLTQIAVLSEVVRQQPNSNGIESRESLDRIANSSREMIDSMSDIVWSVDPEKDRMIDLVLRMRRFAADVLGSKNIAFQFDTSTLDEQKSLDPFTRRNLYLIYKEAINNLVRHSQCTQAEIGLHFENGSLIFKVNDNGKGYDAGVKTSDGHGLKSMRNRAEEMGGIITMETDPGKGTIIVLRVPLK